MIDCGFRLSANNFLFVADTDTYKITLYRLLPIIQPIIGATLVVTQVSQPLHSSAPAVTTMFFRRQIQQKL